MKENVFIIAKAIVLYYIINFTKPFLNITDWNCFSISCFFRIKSLIMLSSS